MTPEPLLAPPPADGALRLAPLAERHRLGLAAICAEDAAIWEMYAVDWGPAGFASAFDAALVDPARIPFAIEDDGTLVGMSAWIDLNRTRRSAEIGSTYLQPARRGTGLNGRIKRMMLDHGFGHGLNRITFSVDVRNARSQAAMRKLGATLDGVMRQDRVTWTGHIRDSAIFSILGEEWPALRHRLDLKREPDSHHPLNRKAVQPQTIRL